MTNTNRSDLAVGIFVILACVLMVASTIASLLQMNGAL